jgi:hypothetical protein
MNAVHWHLVLNHLPVLASFFGLIIFVYGWYRSKEEVIRVALGLFVFSGIAVIPVDYSGGAAEEIVEELDGVSHDDIEHHEEAAETSYYLTILLGLVALVGLFQSIRAGSIPVWMFWVILLVSLVTLGSLARTANDGGKIRHPETEMKAPES